MPITTEEILNKINIPKFEDENKILKSFDNKIPGVIAFFDSGEGFLYLKGEEKEVKKYIILELAKRSVLDYRVEVDKFSEETYKYIFYQYILIIKELHKRGISHRDIKLENMLFTGDDYTLKFCDLGLSASFLTNVSFIILLSESYPLFASFPSTNILLFFNSNSINSS